MPTTFETFSFSGSSENCYGLEIVKTSLLKAGHNVLPFNPDSKNPVLVSLYWPEQIYDFVRFRYQSKMRGRQIITGGNFPTTSPSAVLPFCDSVFLGDGELWDGALDDPHLINSTSPATARAEVQEIMPVPYEDLQQSRRAFIEISRGCKNKCLFCQYGWLKEYREANIVDIKEALKRVKTKSVRVFAADRFQHHDYQAIRDMMESRGKTDTGSDVSIRFLLQNPGYLKYTNKVRVGVEGLSHRLRKMIGKPYTNDDIIKFCTLVRDAGIKSLDFYMIYGLPTETDADVDEYRELLLKLDEIMPPGYALAIHWNAFTPSAMTPLQWAAPAQGEFNGVAALFAGTGNKSIKVYHKPKFTGPWTIIKRMLAIRGSAETKKLVFSVATREAEFKRAPDVVLREFKDATARDLLSEWPIDTPMPWDKFAVYDTATMLRLYKSRLK